MFLRNYPLSNVTSLGVGGPADYFIRPSTTEEIIAAQRFALEKDYPLTVIGYGTNLLVRDGGIRGVVIQIAEPFAKAKVDRNLLTATTGCLFSSVSKLALSHRLSGLVETGPLVKRVDFVLGGELRSWEGDEYSFSYRSSRLQTETEKAIATQVVFELKPGERKEILTKMLELQEQRRAKQPLEYPSAGSTFKRPAGHYVGPLIEGAGLKGLRIGGAEVSRKHAGFLIRVGDAKAADFLNLIIEILRVIWDKLGVHLDPEIRVIGED